MSTWKLFLVSFILSSTLLAGCSGGPKPQHLFKQGDYKTALALYQERAERLPDNAETFRAIGACQYELGDVTAALASLEKAHELDSKDASTLFLLGRVNEKLNDPGGALAAYTAYMERKPDAVEVSARMNLLRRQMLEKQTQILVAREGMMTATPPSRLTLAVFDFENLSPDSLLTPLGKGLAAMLITDLSQADSLRLVERQRLQVLLDELGMTHAAPPAGTPADKPAGEPAATADPILQLKTNLATLISSDGTPYYKGPLDSEQTTMYKNAVRAFQRDAGLVVDGIPGPNTRNAVKAALKAQTSKTGAEGSAFAQGRAPRLGRLLSAGTLLQGSFLTFEEGAQVRLDADLLATETGSPRADVQPAAGKLEQVLHLEKELVLSILAALGLSPSVDERAILMDMPTESFDAFLAYCRGLDMEERGYPAQAAGYYRDAANLDPGFRIASSRADILSVTPEDQESYDAGEMEKIGETKPPTDDRHIHQGEIIGLVPPPEKTQADPQLTPGQKLPTEGTIIVEGDVPN